MKRQSYKLDIARDNGQHVTANHRGDDIDTIGSFPCECIDTIADRTIKKLDACADALTAFEWAFTKIIGERK